MGKRRMALSPTGKRAGDHGGFLGAGRRFGVVMKSGHVVDTNPARRVDREILGKRRPVATRWDDAAATA